MNQPTFSCTCGRGFQQESAFIRHQKSCSKGKKRLFSALSKAKDLLGSVKRARKCLEDNGSSSHPISSETELATSSIVHHVIASVNDAQSNSTSVLTEDIVAAPSESNDSHMDLPLAQRRKRRNDVQLPKCYHQFQDILPEPLPSIPMNTVDQSSDSSSGSSNPTPPLEMLPPFRTPRNIFGLVRQFFTSNPPSHDPEEAVTLEDISAIPGSRREQPPSNMETTPQAPSLYYPYPNKSSLELGDWYWNGGVQKSQQSFNDLLSIVTSPDFDSAGVRATPWDKINKTLGQNDFEEDGNEEWEDEDAGWRKTEVSIQVPFSRTSNHPGVLPYSGVELYHRSLVAVIREKLANTGDDEKFHYEPYQLLWQPDHLRSEVNIQGELYTSPAFMDAHRDLQNSLREPGCDLPRTIAALMFWSDATHLTSFGNAKLWPIYLYFGNESKYRRCKPSCHLGNHVAYFQKVMSSCCFVVHELISSLKLPDSFKDFTCQHTGGKGVGRECFTHCHRELFQAQWGVLLDDEFLEAYAHGIIIKCCDGITRRFYPRIFTYSADYPEK